VAEDGVGTTAGLTPPRLKEEEQRAAQLRAGKRRATGLLVVMTLVFIGLTAFGGDSTLMGYLRAGAEASMVGGLADWFAVTALFRYPLGIPIPHTAVIPARKDQFGRTLGNFVQENFLSPEVIVERLRAANVPTRAAAWLSERENAETLAGHAADLLVGAADVVNDEDVHKLIDEQVGRAVANLDLAPLAGRALRMVTAEHRHTELLGTMLVGLQKTLGEHRPQLRDRFAERAPRWLPNAVEDRIFDRLFDGVGQMLTDVNNDPEHELRKEFDAWLAGFAERLEHSPEFRARGEELKRELREHPELRKWSASLWEDLKTNLRTQAADPTSELRCRMADALVGAGARLRDDPALSAKAEELMESGAQYVAEHFHDEIAGLVSGTISRWDGQETSRRLELLLGPDLQFIRINGTVVGALAGLVIHGISEGLG
jgi:uncharacterized membrane-anchored protein YjiN (DUF445 family)